MKQSTGLLSGLYRTLPVLRAETTKIVGRIPRGVCVYLIDPSACRDETEVTVVGRSLLGDIVEEAIAWEDLRHIELAKGHPALTARCWRGTREEMVELADRLRNDKEPEIMDFGADVEI